MTPELALVSAFIIVSNATLVGMTSLWLKWMGLLPNRDHRGY